MQATNNTPVYYRTLIYLSNFLIPTLVYVKVYNFGRTRMTEFIAAFNREFILTEIVTFATHKQA